MSKTCCVTGHRDIPAGKLPEITAALSAEAGEDVDIDADEPEEKKKDPPAEERDEADTWTSDDKNHD